MPHSTAGYPFEGKIFERLQAIVGRVGEGGCLIWFDSDGQPCETIFVTSESWSESRERVDLKTRPYFLFDPLDMEYHWVSWHGLSQTTMEGLIGARFEDGDFVKHPMAMARAPELEPPEFPTSWSVMF